MGEPFDLYRTTSAEPFREGAVVTLDGIDGFFDQYFEAVRPGQTIRFAVLAATHPTCRTPFEIWRRCRS